MFCASLHQRLVCIYPIRIDLKLWTLAAFIEKQYVVQYLDADYLQNKDISAN